MSEMVERVARAIVKAAEQFDCAPWEDGTTEELDAVRTVVRTAIEAMREPTEEMVRAGRDCPVSHGWTSAGEVVSDPENIWTAMIDAALK